MKEKLHELLKNVPDGYDDFVMAVEFIADEDEDLMKKIVKFLEDNPEAKHDDVMMLIGDIESEE